MTTARRPRIALAHGLRPMVGRDPHQEHRVATPLELLYDLTFVVAFGTAGNQLAHLLAEGHIAAGIVGFGFAMFATCWAWINFSWFASAFDTDDWAYRVAVLVQMIGVIILALGLPAMFHSIDEGEHVDNAVMVLGYVIMRVPLLLLWLRARRQATAHSSACTPYITTLAVAQVGWIGLIFLDTSVLTFFALAAVLELIELAGPWVSERRFGGTPWHPHHIAERYSLLAIITLGEGVIGTVASLSAVIEDQGWTVDTALVALAGTGLTFGMWWVYFVVPSAEILHAHRERSFVFGYGHIVVFAAIAATGAGLHVAAYYLEDATTLGAVGTVLAVVVPVAVFVGAVHVIHTALVGEADSFHTWLLAGTAAMLAAAVALAATGTSMALCLVVVMAAPFVPVIGYEVVGHRHLAAALERQASH